MMLIFTIIILIQKIEKVKVLQIDAYFNPKLTFSLLEIKKY